MLALSCTLLLAGCTGTRPATVGVRDGKLSPCPSSPNCVSSQDSDAVHSIAPLRFTGSPQQAMERLKGIVGGMKRTKIVTGTDQYLHAEVRSALFRFVDDVEFIVDGKNGVIHVRSASRVGYSDLGVNRKRVQAINHAWNAAPEIPSPARP